MTSAISRLRAYADRLDAFKERARYRGNGGEQTASAAAKATAKLSWYEQLVADLREVCAAAERGAK